MINHTWTSLKHISKPAVDWIQTSIMISRQIIVRRWRSPERPTFNNWLLELNKVAAYERISFNLADGGRKYLSRTNTWFLTPGNLLCSAGGRIQGQSFLIMWCGTEWHNYWYGAVQDAGALAAVIYTSLLCLSGGASVTLVFSQLSVT